MASVEVTVLLYSGPMLCSFYCVMQCISAVFAVMQCPSVCLSVTFVSCDKTNKDIFEILVFPHQTGWRYSNGNPHNGGVECKGV